jgi:NADH-quinone oxidoreductase subunit J
VFVVMMLNLGQHSVDVERQWLTPGIWTGPVLLACILLIEVVYLMRGVPVGLGTGAVEAKAVGMALFGPYLIGVELASMLLLAGLVGAYHLGFRKTEKLEIRSEIQHDPDIHKRRAAASGDLVLTRTDQPAGTP